MSWLLSRWVWRLEAPLSIGLPPSGSLNRCRLYVPARNLWGALTAELAQRRPASEPDYAGVGKELQQDLRLTYLFPAEETDRGWRAWLPRYESGKGLVWQREDDANGEKRRSDREMRQRLLLARPGTAIDHASATAADGTLRETECLGQYWRCSGTGETGEVKAVALVGYVFVREGNWLAGALETTDMLMLGGDTRYGLGRVRRVVSDSATQIFGAQAELTVDDPAVRTERVLAHTHTQAQMIGQLEALSIWERASDRAQEARITSLADAPLWGPGSSCATGGEAWWSIKVTGLWCHAASTL